MRIILCSAYHILGEGGVIFIESVLYDLCRSLNTRRVVRRKRLRRGRCIFTVRTILYFSPLKIAAFSGFPFRISSVRAAEYTLKINVHAKSRGRSLGRLVASAKHARVYVKINTRIKS